MDFSQDELKIMAQFFGIPTIPDEQRTWIVRTKGGTHYEDFSRNGFVALGWDNIPSSLISDKNHSKDDVIELIKDEYPDEKRPGLIYGQLIDFIRVMVPGDYVVIPSSRSTYVSIGILGNLYENKVQAHSQQHIDDYSYCPYRLRRHVKWIREVSVSEDVYLAKMLRAQQTISDITKNSGLIFRNLFDLYFIDGVLSLTIRKVSDNATTLLDVAMLQGSIAKLISFFSDIFGDDCKYKIEQKMALSSPGFMQIVTKVKSIAPIVFFYHIFKSLGGKIQTSDGQTIEGIPAYLQAFSNLANDKAERDVKRAQAKKIIAEANKMNSDSEKSLAETQKTLAEANAINLQNAKTMIELFGSTTFDNDPKKLAENGAKLQEELASAGKRYQEFKPIMDRLGINPPIVKQNDNILSHIEKDLD